MHCMDAPPEAIAGPAQQSGLLQLPAEVLHHIWRQCRDHEAQAALRCACTQLRQLADSFITSLYLAHAFTFGDGLQAQLQLHKRDPLTSIVPNMAATLQTFPAAAKLRTLHFNPFLGEGEGPAPGVLSTFLHHVHHTCPGRFQHLASLTISCLTDVTAGDFAALADACEALQHLDLLNVYVCGAAFTPLSRLRALSCLSLRDVCASTGKAFALDSLTRITALTALTSLTINHGFHWGLQLLELKEADFMPDGLLGDVEALPLLSNLPALRHLHLLILNAPDEPCEALGAHIGGLQHLTSLKLEGIRLPPDTPLASASRLVNLDINAVCHAAEVRQYALMPALKTLSLRSVELPPLDPLADLSSVPCGWEQLRLTVSPPPESLVRMPLNPGMQLEVTWFSEWQLRASSGLEAATSMVLRAATWLGCTTSCTEAQFPFRNRPVKLVWDQCPTFACSSLLAALAPMREEIDGVTLSRTWPLSADDVAVGQEHLPNLKVIWLGTDQPGYASFLAALGNTPWLQRLHVVAPRHESHLDDHHYHSEVLDVCRAVQQLALQRATHGWGLEITAYGLPSVPLDALNERPLQLCAGHSSSVDSVRSRVSLQCSSWFPLL